MAEQTVPQRPDHYGHADALNNLRQTARAASIVRAVLMAVDAQRNEKMTFQNDVVSRWASSIDAACWCLEKVRDDYFNTVSPPCSGDWGTPLNLLEAMGAALWSMESGSSKTDMTAVQVRDLCEVILDTLSTLHDDLTEVANSLKGDAA